MTKTQQDDWFWCSGCSGYHTAWFSWSTACSEVNLLAFTPITLKLPDGHTAICEPCRLKEERRLDQHNCLGWYCNCKSTEKVRAELRKTNSD